MMNQNRQILESKIYSNTYHKEITFCIPKRGYHHCFQSIEISLEESEQDNQQWISPKDALNTANDRHLSRPYLSADAGLMPGLGDSYDGLVTDLGCNNLSFTGELITLIPISVTIHPFSLQQRKGNLFNGICKTMVSSTNYINPLTEQIP